MRPRSKVTGFFCLLIMLGLTVPVQAADLLYFIEAKDHARIMSNASGIEITDKGVVYVTSESKATLLKIVGGEIEATSLIPDVFKDSDLGGIDATADGNLVITNVGSGRVGVLGPDLALITRFSQDGDDPGELDKPKDVAVSINNNVYIADSKNKRISVFNQQGLYLHSFGWHSSGNLKQPSHISIDAEENVYALEGEDRISIFDQFGELLARLNSKDLREIMGDKPEISAMTTDLDGNLYIGNRVDNRISIIDWRNKKILETFGSLGQSRSQFRDITYLSVNASGQLAILDKKNKKVEVYQTALTGFATPVVSDLLEHGATIEAQCKSVHAFINDQILCVQFKNKGVVILAADGTEQGKFAEEVKKPGAIHVGDKTVAVLGKNKLNVYTHDGENVFSIGRYGTSGGGFKDPSNVYVHAGLYYVSDKGNNRVQVFSGDGQFLEEIKSNQDGEKLFIEVGPIAVDSKQNLYVADGSSKGLIHIISKERKKIGSIGIEKDSIHKFTRFYGVEIDDQDRVYVLASTKFNRYGVRIYKDLKLFKSFASAGRNGTLVYFAEATSLSVLSGSKNSVYINDIDREKNFRFDFLEYPDAAFALNLAANRNSVELNWSSSQSPLIEKYEIQASLNQDGPYTTIAESSEIQQSLSNEVTGEYNWFQIVSVSGHGLQAAPSKPKENTFRRIAVLHAAGEHAEAIKLADRLLLIAPDNADVRDLLGESLFQTQDYTRSIAEFKLLEEVEGYRNKAIRFQVQAFYELEQYLDARALIDEVLEQVPEDVEPYLICTRLSLELADAIGAVTCAEDGLILHENHVELRYLLGRAYIEAGLAEDGLMAYETIIEANPDNHEIRLKIAADLYDMGSYEEALAHYDVVFVAEPKNGVAAVGKARSLLNLDRDEEAKSIAVKLSGKKETKGAGYYLLGKIAARKGKHKEAVLRLTRAGKDSPEVVDAWVSLAQAYQEINQQPKAVKSLAQGIKHNPEAFELFELAGKIELEREQYPEANAYLETAVTLNPASLDARKFYARGLFATRNYRNAAVHAEAAARIAPDDVDVLVLQADIDNQQGKTGSAIEFLKTAISIDTSSPELEYRIGRVYQDANLFDDSRNHLERAAGIRPNWADPHIALGNLYSKRRLFDDAVSSYEKAVDLDPSEENRAILNVAFAERAKSLEFENNAAQLLLSDLNLERVFSAAYKKYLDQPIGSVKLQNVSATDYGNLKLSFQIKEFMDFPSSVNITQIKGSEIQEIPIKATFNNKILEVDEDTGVQVEVKLTYLRDGQKDDITLTQPMTIYGKNAIVWSDSAMVGSFVTPKDDTLRDYVRQVINTFQPDPGPLNDKLVSAMSYFSSLTAAGTNYIIDPNTPFTELRDDQIDYVQFPRETLHLKSGDCDDLSVLISAGLENLGINTALIEIPGHLFMMFDTGIAAEDAGLISQDFSLLAFKDGNVWIPLEATMVNTSFAEAWAEGANKYQKAAAGNQLGIIELSQAWQEYKPVTLRKASYSIELPEKKRTESLINQSRNILLAKSIDRLVLPYQTMVANNPKNITARLQVAILYARYGLYDDATIAFEALNELAPGNSAVKTNQGNMFFLQEDFSKAIDSYNEATKLDTEDGGIWINLSMAQYKGGNLNDARTSYQQAVQLNANLEQEYNAYSKLLSQ
jgi:tetratricopeptide (TPR) repeat protein